MLRHVFRGDQIFLNVVKAATMHLPFLAIGPFGHIRHGPQPQIQGNEKQGCANPRHRRDDMQPPDGKRDPIPNDGQIIHTGISLLLLVFPAY